jgi:D-xylose transport system permease protein
MTLPERVKRREVGALPVLTGLLVVAVVFQSLNANFLTPRNLTSLGLQIAAMTTVSCGLVLVLLLGEMDLAAGAVSGLCAAAMAVLVERHGLPGPLGVAAAILLGGAIGVVQGLWITRFKVPSFVVTLATVLAWQGAQLAALSDTGSLNLTDPFILGLCGVFISAPAGVVIVLGGVVLGAAAMLWPQWKRRTLGLKVSAGSVTGLLMLGTGAGAPLAMLAGDRGVPLALLLVVALVALLDFMVRRTRFGRHVLAVGGNAEAARRAGIPVERVRVTVFALAAALAAFGGVLAGSRLRNVHQSSGGGDLLLNAIAAAVVGGTSLLGGSGSMWSALTGALAIGAISNGMDLLSLASPVKYLVTAAVMLAAVTVDALAKRKPFA